VLSINHSRSIPFFTWCPSNIYALSLSSRVVHQTFTLYSFLHGPVIPFYHLPCQARAIDCGRRYVVHAEVENVSDVSIVVDAVALDVQPSACVRVVAAKTHDSTDATNNCIVVGGGGGGALSSQTLLLAGSRSTHVFTLLPHTSATKAVNAQAPHSLLSFDWSRAHTTPPTTTTPEVTVASSASSASPVMCRVQKQLPRLCVEAPALVCRLIHTPTCVVGDAMPLTLRVWNHTNVTHDITVDVAVDTGDAAAFAVGGRRSTGRCNHTRFLQSSLAFPLLPYTHSSLYSFLASLQE
jgi:hypothetical protein